MCIVEYDNELIKTNDAQEFTQLCDSKLKSLVLGKNSCNLRKENISLVGKGKKVFDRTVLYVAY